MSMAGASTASREELKRRASETIDSRADELVALAKTILENPEPGFRETKTSRLVAGKFAELGIPARIGLGLTGVRADLPGGSPGPALAIIGELDSLIVNEHPHADKETGAAHACGHHCQIGMITGAAMALMQADVLESLSGRLAFIAVPAEEYIEIEYRDSLRRQGKLEFLGGKPELVRLGEFDDIDLAMMCHTTANPDERLLCTSAENNGTIAKKIQFVGTRRSRRGSAPPGHQRPECRVAGAVGHPSQPRDVPGRGQRSGSPHHHQGRRGGERRSRRRADGDVRAGPDAGRHHGRQRQG